MVRARVAGDSTMTVRVELATFPALSAAAQSIVSVAQ
jgi:hypothetical protein